MQHIMLFEYLCIHKFCKAFKMHIMDKVPWNDIRYSKKSDKNIVNPANTKTLEVSHLKDDKILSTEGGADDMFEEVRRH